MKKILKTIFVFILSMFLLLNPIFNIYAQETETNQIKYVGGKASADGVKISKTISKSNLENYFDITLTVETTSKIEEITKAQDLAVVLVMDISNTMNEKFKGGGSSTKISAAKNSAIDFIKEFYKYSMNSNAVRQIGLVTFNRDSHDIFGGLKNVNSTSKTTLIDSVNGITAPSGADIKWTNMESGLKMGNDLLATTSVKNKYIIFLTDGLPTTYIKSGYEGYTPAKTTHNSNKGYVEGNFYNFVKNKKVPGTNYSEFGARKAELQAYGMKNNGIKIYSIGIGITSQSTLYHLQYETTGDGYILDQTVDTDTEKNNHNYTRGVTYRVPRYYTILPGVNVPSKNATTDASVRAKYNDTSYYETWLSEYIGSDAIGTNEKNRKYYYDSDNKTALENAYKEIFNDIKEMTDQEINASWVAEDPMNASGQTKNIQFVGLYDDNMNLKNELNTANAGESDTASYNEAKDTISWDLKTSTRTETKKQENGKKVMYYKYEIKYKIRLENELKDFVEKKDYSTNGKTYLDYVVIENINGVNVRSEKRTLEFPVPKVEGYLGTLEFAKKSSYKDQIVSDANFELVHADDCPCKKEIKHMNANFKLTSTSNSNGKVTFNNIPSGHTYKLKEVKTDDYHTLNETIYDVNVSYGKTIHNIENSTVINNINTKDLVIVKEVKNITTNKSFDFEINATYKEEKINGTYQVIRTTNGRDTNEEITFVDGVATFKLKHNESITIKDLPIKINFNIKELNIDGFNVKYQVNDGNIKKFNDKELENNTLEDNMKIKFINSSGYVMPGTGSSGMLILAIIGTLLLLIPILYISVNILKKD